MKACFVKDWDFETLGSLGKVSPFALRHLRKVYLFLFCCLIFSALGAYLHLLWNIGGLLTAAGFIGTISWLLSITPWMEKGKKVSLLMVAGLFSGTFIGPLINLVLTIDQRTIICALLGAAAAFGCFFMAAMFMQRRGYIYLCGLLFSCLSIPKCLHYVLTIFFGGYTSFWDLMPRGFLFYLGVVGYIVVYSQEIIQEARRGNLDYVRHALTFCADWPSDIIRFVTLLLKKPYEKDKEKKKRT